MKRNLAALGGGTAAGVNAGTLVNQADKIVYLDPNTEILYDPAENIRNGKVVDDSIDGLIKLRLTIEGSKQIQPIRVYPLPQNKLDPSKPALKYGIAVGHRRTLCSRLTSADHPLISDLPRKVAAVVDTDWLKRGRSYQLRCQIHENTARVDLNPVELGQALLDYKRELSSEEKRVVPQTELMEVYGLPEKTVYLLPKAAEFHTIAKDACHLKLISDLDVMNTFNQICVVNEELGRAIFKSLKEEGAPNSRNLMRQARALAENKDFVFDEATWSWPDSVERAVVKPASKAPAPTVKPQTPGQSIDQQKSEGTQGGAEGAALEGEGQARQPDKIEKDSTVNVSEDDQQASNVSGSNTPSRPAEPNNQSETAPGAIVGNAAAMNGPEKAIIMVEFKMGAEAKNVFTGELIVSKKSKAPSMGVVAYLNDEGREEQVEVPLKLISIVSINHP